MLGFCLNSVGPNPICGSEVGIFGGFYWVHSSVLIGKPEFRKVRSSFFSRFGPGFGSFFDKHVQSSGYLEGFKLVQSSVLVDEPGFE